VISAWTRFTYDEVASTNDVAAAHARAGGALPAMFVARNQTAGRGQHGRSWVSVPGTGLYASFAVAPNIQPSQVPLIPLAAGLAVMDAVAEQGPAPLALKWPNDLWVASGPLRTAKVGGILVEGAITAEEVEHVVIGIGVNLTRAAREVDVLSASLEELLPGAPPSADALADAIARRLGVRLDALVTSGASAIVPPFEDRIYGAGRRATWTDGRQTLTGTFRGLAADGAALMDTEAGPQHLHHGRFIAFGSDPSPSGAER
jgi:BirA family biotin operon repressor/biotin-[acetyl-CoA-carboxylase] ligase